MSTLKIENLHVSIGEKEILKGIDLVVNTGETHAIMGPNGNGKSTLVKMLSSHLPMMEGLMKKSGKLKIGYFNQNQTEELPLELTPTEYMKSIEPDTPEKNIRAHLGHFGLEQEKAVTQIKALSGGEKTRLLFARISIDKPELLIFDEPTNHLDMEGRTALAEALNAYNGAIILISHDFHLLEMVVDNLWLVHNNTCTAFDGDLEDYRAFLLNKEKKKEEKPEKKEIKEQVKLVPPIEKNISNNKQDRKVKAELRQIEQELSKLEAKKAELLQKFAQVSGSEVAKMQIELYNLEQEITATEEKWMELSETIN